MKPQKYRLSQYTSQTYKDLADQFEDYFLQDNFKTSAENSIRNRYEVIMPNVDAWINRLNLELTNFGMNDATKFKQGLWNNLKKRGWTKAKIHGRWQKIIFI